MFPRSGWWVLSALVVSITSLQGQEPSVAEVGAAMRRAVDFFHGQVAAHGGYLYRYSADLSRREGEEKADQDTVWVQPPGTPAVGLTYLEAYERTGERYLLDAARDAGECLARGQLRSGGWMSHIDLSEAGHRRYAYRLDPPRAKIGSNWTTFDDNKTQSALTFLMRLDQTLGFKDPRIHDAAQYGLEAVLKAQYPNGAWPQGYQEFPDPGKFPVKKATYPSSWSREYSRSDYRGEYTFNDNAIADTIDMLFLAARIYRQPKYREAALRAGDFILLAQMPEPQPAWAQQYNVEMQPVWARRFEPPAISGGESQGLLRTLQRLYVETGDRKYLGAIPSAVAYLRRSQLPDRRLARFYELQTNKPLYFTREYVLTYDDGDLPTHYAFKISSNLDAIEREQQRLEKATPQELEASRERRWQSRRVSSPPASQVVAAIKGLDARGAWVEPGKLRTHGDQDEAAGVIDTRTFIKNLDLLSRFVGAQKR